MLLKYLEQRLKRKNLPVPDFYFTLLDGASITPDIVINQGVAAYGSVRNLAKAAKLSPSKVREFSHSKTSYTRFTQATRKFNRMRAFARFKGEIWCMDLAFVDNLAKDSKAVKNLGVRQDLFDRTLDAKGMKRNDSKERANTF